MRNVERHGLPRRFAVVATLFACVPELRAARVQEERYAIEAFVSGLDPPSAAAIVAELSPAPTVDQALAAELHQPLTDGDVRRSDALETRITEAIETRAFEEAIAAAHERAEFLEGVLGPDHWRCVEARLLLEDLHALAELPEADRDALLEARAQDDEQGEAGLRGEPAAAVDAAWRALDVRFALGGDDPLERADAVATLGWALLGVGQSASAEVLAREAWRNTREVLEAPHPRLAHLQLLLGRIALERGRTADAEVFVLHALRDFRRTHGADHRGAIFAQGLAVGSMQLSGRLAEAERLARALLERGRALEPIDRLNTIHNLAVVLRKRGRYAESAELFREALAHIEEAHGEESVAYAATESEYARVLIDMGALEEAEAHARRALESLRDTLPGTHPRIAFALQNLAESLVALGRLAEAEDLLGEAIDVLSATVDRRHPGLLELQSGWTEVLMQRGDLERAEPVVREVVEEMARVQGEGSFDHLCMSMNLGFALEERGAFAEARELFEYVQAGFERLGESAHPYRARSLEALGRVAAKTGALEDASRALREAVALLDAVPLARERDRLWSLSTLGCVRFDAGELDEAEALFDQALERTRLAFGSRDRDLSRLLVNRAIVLQRRGEREDAARDLLEALDIAEGLRSEVSGGERARSLHSIGHADIADRLAALLVELGRYEEAFAVRERGEGRVLLDLLARSGLDLPAAAEASRPEQSARLRRLIDVEEEARAARLREENRMAALVARVDLGSAREERLAEQADIVGRTRTAALDAEAAVIAALSSVWPEARVATPGELRAAFHEGELCLAYLWTPELVAVLALAGGSAQAPIGGQTIARGATEVRDLGERVAAVVAAMSRPASSVEERAAAARARHALGATLVPASLELAEKLVSRVVILPDGPLVDLPFEPLAPGGTTSELCELVRDVAYASSASVYVDRRREAASRGPAPRTALVVGDPRFHAQPRAEHGAGEPSNPPHASGVRDGLVQSDLDRLRLFGGDLSRLPGTAREAQAIERVLREAEVSVQLLTGAGATRAAVEAAAPAGAFLHLATHGLAGTSARPFDACLALARPEEGATAPDFLTLEDLLRDWSGKLANTRLVVLSACDTQRGTQVGASSLALPWGFFFAGAPTVVASLWRVDDDATTLLMERFYENLLGRFDLPRTVGGVDHAPGEAMPKGRALLESKLWLRSADRSVVRARMRDRGPTSEPVPAPSAADLVPYADPYFWAGFVLVGDAD